MEARVANGTLVYRYTLDNEYPPPMIEYVPVRWVAFVFSAVFPLLAIRAVAVGRAVRAPWICAAALAPLLLFIALVLRGAAGAWDGDAFRMYETQTVLHLCAGHVLVGVLLAFAAKWYVRWIEIESQAVAGVFLGHVGIAYTATALVFTCVGFPLAFDASEERRISGYRLVSAGLITALGMVLLGATLALYHTDARRGAGGAGAAAQRLTVIWVPAALLVCWAAFALARMSLPMAAAANRSEALFYCLAVLPAAGALAVWTGQAEELLLADTGADADKGQPRGACRCEREMMSAADPCQAVCYRYEASLQRAMQKYA
ncbi:hypothetical protein H4R18_004202 [Coemansia javaensis]|uniref:Uncharacterized protein n=1 Tax=Coemansia javaensis TaxID=2761396 RepID=A0A9W8LHF9_9FUNG|nr:hypothetical protein H4R18_004202 [Coemansia javaensis]